VEYQGDRRKATFYYTAEERVDFRELIRKLADSFKVRVEMRQIGYRQEAGRLGAIGSCGRELCCSTWLTDFRSVSTSAARYQQLSLNPLKLAGQCGKLKCCLNYELDSYLDALKDFPDAVDLETARGRARHQKTDIFKGLMFFTFADEPDQFIPVPVKRVKEVIEMNKRGEKPDELGGVKPVKEQAKKEPDFENVVGQDSLTRFDNSRKKKKKKKKRPEGAAPQQGQHNRPPQQNRPKQQQKQQGQHQAKPQGQPQNKPQHNKPQQGQPQKPGQQNPGGGRSNNNNQRNRPPRRNSGPRPPQSPPPPKA